MFLASLGEGEGDDVANVRAIGEEHDQAIDAQAPAPRRWKPILKCSTKVVVGDWSLQVSV